MCIMRRIMCVLHMHIRRMYSDLYYVVLHAYYMSIMNICAIKDIKTLKTYKKFNVELLESFVNSIFD